MSLNLNNLLIELGHKDAPLHLTMNDIIATIDAYREANNDENPMAGSGKIQDGPLAKKTTWAAINEAIRHGRFGLKKDTVWKNLNTKLVHRDLTLHSLLIDIGYKKRPLNLKMKQIIEAIDIYRSINNGRNPVKRSGLIKHGFLAEKITWSALDQAISNEGHGLKEDPEWQQFKNKIKDKTLNLSMLLIALGHKDGDLQLTMSIVIATIDAYRQAHDGNNPQVNSGTIKVGPLAGKTSWTALNQALPMGYSGLKGDPQWQALNTKLDDKKITISTLLLELGYRDAPLHLTMNDIIATIDAYRAAHNGKNPSRRIKDINIEEGPLAGLTTWPALDASLIRGGYGLKDDQRWISFNIKLRDENITISKLLMDLGYKEPPLRLTIDDIVATVTAYRNVYDGENPTQYSGKITQGPLAGKMNWNTLNAALTNGRKTLKNDSDWQMLSKKYGGKFSLSKLNREHPWNPKTPSIDYDAPGL